MVIANKKVTKADIERTLKVLADNGIEEDETETVLQAVCYTLLGIEIFEEV